MEDLKKLKIKNWKETAKGGWGSLVCMATIPKAGWFAVRILVGTIFFSSPKCPDRL
jgi:hypothetical protein